MAIQTVLSIVSRFGTLREHSVREQWMCFLALLLSQNQTLLLSRGNVVIIFSGHGARVKWRLRGWSPHPRRDQPLAERENPSVTR